VSSHPRRTDRRTRDKERTILAKAATSAAILLAAAAFAGCGGSGDKAGPTEKDHTEFVKGCRDGGAPNAFCECLYDELVKKRGIDTRSEFSQLTEDASKAGTDASAVPDQLRKAAQACKSAIE
jgi:hypothetical protein